MNEKNKLKANEMWMMKCASCIYLKRQSFCCCLDNEECTYSANEMKNCINMQPVCNVCNISTCADSSFSLVHFFVWLVVLMEKLLFVTCSKKNVYNLFDLRPPKFGLGAFWHLCFSTSTGGLKLIQICRNYVNLSAN